VLELDVVHFLATQQPVQREKEPRMCGIAYVVNGALRQLMRMHRPLRNRDALSATHCQEQAKRRISTKRNGQPPRCLQPTFPGLVGSQQEELSFLRTQ